MVIPGKDMFIAEDFKIELKRMDSKRIGRMGEVHLVLERNDKRNRKYEFSRSPTDHQHTKFLDHDLVITMREIPMKRPILLLMCAEIKSLMTKLYQKIEDPTFSLVTLTEDDNLLSVYGRHKWKACIRNKDDCVFFAGPCTGGSPWNGLNKTVSEVTAHMIRMKASTYWQLWDEFCSCLLRAIDIGGMALMELPRGCDYWHDKRLVEVIEGTENHCHEFDGCMYGLKAQFSENHDPIKNSWRIISWGVKFNSLNRKCDGSHRHDKCEGKETKETELYTKSIIGKLFKSISNRTYNSTNHQVWNSRRKAYKETSSVRSGFQRKVAVCISSIEQDASFTWLCYCRRLNTSAVGSPAQYEPVLRERYLVLRTKYSSTWLWGGTPIMAASSSMQTVGCKVNDSGSALLRQTNVIVVSVKKRFNLPPRIGSTAEGLQCSPETQRRWELCRISPILLYPAIFASRRSRDNDIMHTMEVTNDFLNQVKNSEERETNAKDFIHTIIKVLNTCKSMAPGRREVHTENEVDEHGTLGISLLMTDEILGRIIELWDVLLSQFSPKPLGHGINVEHLGIAVGALVDQFRNATGAVHAGNSNHPPKESNTAISRLEGFLRLSRELYHIVPLSKKSDDLHVLNLFGEVEDIVNEELLSLGYSLRKFNTKCSNPAKRFILKDVLEDLKLIDYDLPLERAAAVNSVEAIMMRGQILGKWETKAKSLIKELDEVKPGEKPHPELLEVIRRTREFVGRVMRQTNISEELLLYSGFNVTGQEQGTYHCIAERNKCFSLINDFLTSKGESQGAHKDIYPTMMFLCNLATEDNH